MSREEESSPMPNFSDHFVSCLPHHSFTLPVLRQVHASPPTSAALLFVRGTSTQSMASGRIQAFTSTLFASPGAICL